MGVIQKQKVLEEKISETELMLYDEKTGLTHLLNSTAAFFYNLCGNISLNEIVNKYICAGQKFGHNEDILRADALKIYKMLKEKRLIEEVKK
jgi:hypothetical protein